MRKFWRVFLVLLLLLFLFRGQAYRLVTNYDLVDYRVIATNPDQRLQKISDSLYLQSDDREGFVLNVQDYTTGALQFSFRFVCSSWWPGQLRRLRSGSGGLNSAKRR